jgi:patatin-related protein
MNQPSDGGSGVPEEIRFAVVLNGGVSLAVWMGGVVREIDRVTRGKGPYGCLLDLLGVTARADVIAGTSAGGINGAALALSQANEQADVGVMRDLWSEQGRMESLLQRPFKGSPASLLRGDDYFLPKLHEAMTQLSKGLDGSKPPKHPLELIITTTLLHGARTVTVDSLGQQLPQLLHQGRFTFRRDETRDDFKPEKGHEFAAALAIAARCTAGFPLAFEPCFVPARHYEGPASMPSGKPMDLTDPAARPDLGAFVSWRSAGPAEGMPPDRSRYAVDGGLLANTPTQAALDAIARMPASGLVQRVMLLVYPHAPVNRPDLADQDDAPPTAAGAMGGVLGALLSQGNRTFVDEVEAHNQAAAARRGTRLDIMDGLDGPEDLKKLASCLIGQYLNQRIRRAARDLTERVVPPADWSLRRIGRAVEIAQREWEKTEPRGLPYVPAGVPDEDTEPAPYWEWGTTAALDVADAVMDLLHRLISVTSEADVCDRLSTARTNVSAARATLREVRQQIDQPWLKNEVLSTLRPGVEYWTLRLAHYARAMAGDSTEVDAAEAAVVGFEIFEDARDKLSSGLAIRDNKRRAALRSLTAQPDDPERNQYYVPTGTPGSTSAAAIGTIVSEVIASLDALRAVTDVDIAEWAGLKPWQNLLGHLPEASNLTSKDQLRSRVLARLLWLHIAAWTLADESGAASSHSMDLVQISLQTQNHFAQQSTTLDDKVGGMSLNRFGGFLKRSWRMNDWTWGRMDAATMLCQIILSPERLRRRAVQRKPETAAEFVRTLTTRLFASPLPDELRSLADEAAVELEPVYSLGKKDLPASLPKLAALAAWAVHLRAVVEELPSIEAAVKADHVDRANPDSKGELFLIQNSSLLTRLKTIARDNDDPARLTEHEVKLGTEALRAFDRAGVGREPLDEEARSDQLIRTAATAASVAVTVADSSRSGLAAIKPVTRMLRGGMMMPYWTVLGLAGGGAIARFLAQLALASGALLLALSLLGRIGGWAAGPATAIGVGALLTAFGFAAMRTGTLLHSVVLLTPVIPLVAFAAQGWSSPNNSDRNHSLAVAGTIVALALALMLLGSLPSQLRSPAATTYRALDKLVKHFFHQTASDLSGSRRFLLRLLAALGWLVMVAVGLGILAATVFGLFRLVEWMHEQAEQWKTERLWLLAIALIVVAVGLAVGYGAGWRLRTWSELRTESGVTYRTRGVSHSSGVAATWSVVYGTCYAAIAVGIIWWWPPEPDWVWRSALATAVVFTLLLLYVVPVAIMIGSIRSVSRRLVADARSAVIAWSPDAADPAVVELFWKADLRFRCLLKRSAPASLDLTRGGRRLRKRINKLVAAA